jgi:hypothetical protein
MSMLAKNAALAFLAGFVTSLGTFVIANPDNPGVSALEAAGVAAVYAGGRALVGYLKARFGDAPFSVDVEL